MVAGDAPGIWGWEQGDSISGSLRAPLAFLDPLPLVSPDAEPQFKDGVMRLSAEDPGTRSGCRGPQSEQEHLCFADTAAAPEEAEGKALG